MSEPVATHADHFEDLERQAYAARLGMWLFLGSELLFFSGLFALYAGYRAEHPVGFGVGVLHNTLVCGSTNTAVLLASSYAVALAVHAVRVGRRTRALACLTWALLLGLSFLAIKSGEYLHHFREGIYPGGVGRFYEDHAEPGVKMFFTLYYCMTGLHAIHVVVGMGVLSYLLVRVFRRTINSANIHPLVVGAIYWHLVDVIWIFLWPLFYLVPGAAR
jgi:cytochrome c oxidase subunit III